MFGKIKQNWKEAGYKTGVEICAKAMIGSEMYDKVGKALLLCHKNDANRPGFYNAFVEKCESEISNDDSKHLQNLFTAIIWCDVSNERHFKNELGAHVLMANVLEWCIAYAEFKHPQWEADMVRLKALTVFKKIPRPATME